MSALAGKTATPMLALIRALWPPTAKGSRERADDPLGEQAGMGRLAAALLDDRELVAAEAGDQLVAAHHRAQPVGDLDQQLVAGRMAVNVVDRLEAVEVDAQHRDRLARLGRRGSTLRARWSSNTARLGRPVSAS